MILLAHITAGDILIVAGAFALGALASATVMAAARFRRSDSQKPV